jgi:transcriptional regulator with XRE-family HTH domain
MAKKANKAVEDQLRQEIRTSGLPQNKICRAARMDEGTLSCFMLGKQESMRLKTAQRLARVLGYELVLEAQKGGPKISAGSAPTRKKTKKVAKAKKAKKATRTKKAKKAKRKKARRR